VTTPQRGRQHQCVGGVESVILGIDGSNSNTSWGTFYEGTIVAGFPADDTELSVLRNIQAFGYGR